MLDVIFETAEPILKILSPAVTNVTMLRFIITE